MAVLYHVNGTTVDVRPSSGKHFSLEELQGFVGGYIQIESISDTLVMVMNEEGKLNHLPENRVATRMFRARPQGALPGDYIVGDVVVMNRWELEDD